MMTHGPTMKGRDMKRKQIEHPPAWRARWWIWTVLGGIGLIVIATGMLWWFPAASAGSPRLVLDQDLVDLGDLAFGAPAGVVFTLTNAGDAPLRIAERVRVTAVKGC